ASPKNAASVRDDSYEGYGRTHSECRRVSRGASARKYLYFAANATVQVVELFLVEDRRPRLSPSSERDRTGEAPVLHGDSRLRPRFSSALLQISQRLQICLLFIAEVHRVA